MADDMYFQLRVQCGTGKYYRGLSVKFPEFDGDTERVAMNRTHRIVKSYVTNGCWVKDHRDQDRFLSPREISHITILKGDN